MNNVERSAALRAAVAGAVSADRVLAAPPLSAAVTDDGRLPLSILATAPPVARLRPSRGEIVSACAALGLRAAQGCVCLGWRADGTALEVRTRAGRAALERCAALLGGRPAANVEDCGDHFLVRDDRGYCFALWRALVIVPCGGEIADVRMRRQAVEAEAPPRFRSSRGLTPLKIVFRDRAPISNRQH